MGLYSRYVLPRLIHFTCALEPAMRQREKVVPRARGRVLEIGIGSGLNLPYYEADSVAKVWGLEPSPEMARMAEKAAAEVGLEVELLEHPAEEIPLESDSVDTVVVTYTLCTIPEPETALAEMRRVLAPGGALLFCEHGAAPDPAVRRWQRRLTPLWKRFAGGCHLDRDIPAVLEGGGFAVEEVETMYLPGWRPATFNYWGRAVPR